MFFWQSYNSWFKTPGLQDSGTPRLWDSKTPGLWDSRTPGLPNSKTPKLQDSQTPRLPDSHTESQCERLCIWGAPHIFQMKYFAIWVAKFLETWQRAATLLVCSWPVRMVSRRSSQVHLGWTGTDWLVISPTLPPTSMPSTSTSIHISYSGGGEGGVWGKVEIKVGRGQPQ